MLIWSTPLFFSSPSVIKNRVSWNKVCSNLWNRIPWDPHFRVVHSLNQLIKFFDINGKIGKLQDRFERFIQLMELSKISYNSTAIEIVIVFIVTSNENLLYMFENFTALFLTCLVLTFNFFFLQSCLENMCISFVANKLWYK